MICGKSRVEVCARNIVPGRARKGDPMNAVVFHGIGDIRLEKVKDPALKQPSDAIVKLSASAICGTDFGMIRGTLGEMAPGNHSGA